MTIVFMPLEEPLRVIIENNETLGEWIKNPSSLIAIFALGTSIAGLLFTVWYTRRTLKITIDHNQKTVEPLLEIDTFQDFKSSSPHSRLEIRNGGVGPAIIKNVHLEFNNNTYTDIYHLIKNEKKDIYDRLRKDKCEVLYEFPNTCVIAPNDLKTPYDLYFSIGDDTRNNFMMFLGEVDIIIDYESIYQQKKRLKQKIIELEKYKKEE
jgi:hypothetical protein